MPDVPHEVFEPAGRSLVMAPFLHSEQAAEPGAGGTLGIRLAHPGPQYSRTIDST